MFNGILLVDKPQGFTSHDLGAKLRGIFKTRQIGHAGTLDPMATGLMIMMVGKACAASDYLMAEGKEYVAGLRLGITTDTQDITGRVTSETQCIVNEAQVAAAAAGFVGAIKQVPPMYSAIQINGQRLYKLARQGVEVERESRDITIHSIKLLGKDGNDFLLKVSCSKGTYIRTLCHDIGQVLGCGGTLSLLNRTKTGPYSLKDAYSLDTIQDHCTQGTLAQLLTPVDSVFLGFPRLNVNTLGDIRTQHGTYLRPEHIVGGVLPSEGTEVRLYSSAGAFIQLGIVRPNEIGNMVVFCKKNFM